MATSFENFREDLLALHAEAKEFIGEFLFSSFGIEPTGLMNAMALYTIALLVIFLLYRIFTPARESRYRQDHYGINFGRER